MMIPCYVYVIKSGKSANSPIKIGMANNPDERIKQLQTGNPVALKLIMRIKCKDRKHALNLERTLHEMLAGQNVLGEWFKVMRSNLYKTINAIGENNEIPTLEVIERLFEEEPPTKTKATKLEKAIKHRDALIDQLSIKLNKKMEAAKVMRAKIFDLGIPYKEIDEMIKAALNEPNH